MCKINIVMYHYVRDLQCTRYPEIKGLDYRLFKEQVSFFSERYNIIKMEDLLNYYKSGKVEKLPDNAMLLTFDDGYIDNYNYVFPVLDELRIQGSFFVPCKVFLEQELLDVNKIHFLLASAPIEVLCRELFARLDFYRGMWNYPSNEELFCTYAVANRFDSKEVIFFKRVLQNALPEQLRGIICDELYMKFVGVPEKVMAHELYLNYDQMKMMKRAGMYFGVHGYDHYWLNKLSKSEIEIDIDRALTGMKELINTNAWVMNYPYGSYSQEVVDVISSKGCILGLSTDVRKADLEIDDRYILPRLDCNDFPPISERYTEL